MTGDGVLFRMECEVCRLRLYSADEARVDRMALKHMATEHGAVV